MGMSDTVYMHAFVRNADIKEASLPVAALTGLLARPPARLQSVMTERERPLRVHPVRNPKSQVPDPQ